MIQRKHADSLQRRHINILNVDRSRCMNNQTTCDKSFFFCKIVNIFIWLLCTRKDKWFFSDEDESKSIKKKNCVQDGSNTIFILKLSRHRWNAMQTEIGTFFSVHSFKIKLIGLLKMTIVWLKSIVSEFRFIGAWLQIYLIFNCCGNGRQLNEQDWWRQKKKLMSLSLGAFNEQLPYAPLLDRRSYLAIRWSSAFYSINCAYYGESYHFSSFF